MEHKNKMIIIMIKRVQVLFIIKLIKGIKINRKIKKQIIDNLINKY